ncbi:MAG: ATP-dependent nuclease [Spirochaetia bacterium]
MKVKFFTISHYRSIGEEITVYLEDYTVLIGANNAGKSSILKAILTFFNKKSKFTSTDYYNFDEGQEPRISMTIEDNAHNLICYHKNGVIEVVDGKITAEECQPLDALFGDPIYIPSMEKIEDASKTTSTNYYGQILALIKKQLPSYKKYEQLTTLIQEINQDVENPMRQLEGRLNERLQEFFGNHYSLNIETNLTDKHFLDNSKMILLQDMHRQKNRLDPEKVGSGMQRQIVYELIMLLSDMIKDSDGDTKKYLLLFDEPEAFLHPSLQDRLSQHLRMKIAENSHFQVVVASHSVNFVASGRQNIPSLARVFQLPQKMTKIAQIIDFQYTFLGKVQELRQEFFPEDYKNDNLDSYKYLSWIDKERAQLFFADYVLCVEGATEKYLFEYMLDHDPVWSQLRNYHLYILNCGGKFDIIYWAQLLRRFQIPFGIIHDEDYPGFQHRLNAHLKILYPTNIVDILRYDLESFLGIKKDDKDSDGHRKNRYIYQILPMLENPDILAKLAQIRDKITIALSQALT